MSFDFTSGKIVSGITVISSWVFGYAQLKYQVLNQIGLDGVVSTWAANICALVMVLAAAFYIATKGVKNWAESQSILRERKRDKKNDE